MVGFIKKLLGREASFELSPEIKNKVQNLIIANLESYGENYRKELSNVANEWKEEGKEFNFPSIDKEAHNRAGVETVKDEISKVVWEQTEADVEKEVRAKVDNELAVKAAKKVGEKGIEKMVDKTVDKALDKLKKKFAGGDYNAMIEVE